MTLVLKLEYLEEPDLLFGHQREEKDPRIGLKYHGPYFFTSERGPTPGEVKVGIVGNSVTLALTKDILNKLRFPLPSLESNKWLYPDYPGFNKEAQVKCEFLTSPSWEATIRENEVEGVIRMSDPNRRIAAGVNLFVEKVRAISHEDDRPNVVVCALPLIMEEYCGPSEKTRGSKRLKFTRGEKERAELAAEGQTFLREWGIDFVDNDAAEPRTSERRTEDDIDLDFHNALKGKIMELDWDITVQLLRESTSRGFLNYGEPSVKLTQDPSTVAWNLSTALYYKANGKPWRLAKLREDNCYVGISFFHNLLNPSTDIQTSMAQVFTHTGEGFVLRGTDVFVDKKTKEPHMSRNQARALVKDALQTYKDRAKRDPLTVALYKTTLFSEEEEAGIGEAIGGLGREFVTITTDHDFRFAREGNYPVLRGTAVYLADGRCLLYTTGYIPRVRTYPGPGIPRPLLVTHHGDSELRAICRDIMSLTKLNWNTTAFASYRPITLEFSEKVGRVLSELPEGKPIKHHYRFYM